MKASEDLFLLVKSLTKTEKRHFKLFASLHSGEKNYVRLFDAIEKQTKYDERAIIKFFSKEKFAKNFAVTKIYLYDSILKSLELFNAGSTNTMQLRTLLSRAELLTSKGLFKQGVKLLRKAKKIAEKNDDFTYQLEISETEQKQMINLKDQDWFRTNIKNKVAYEKGIILKLQNLQKYDFLNTSFVLVRNSAANARTLKEMQQMETVEHIDLLKNEANALSDRAMVLHKLINAQYYYAKGEFHKSVDWLFKVKIFIEQTALRKKKYLSSYIEAIMNILVVGKGVFSFEKLIAAANSFKETISASPVKYRRLIFRYHANILNVCGFYVRAVEGLMYVKATEKWLLDQKEKPVLSDIDFVYIQLCYIYFLNGKYKHALLWMNKLLTTPEIHTHELYVPVQLFNLVIHYELGNRDLLNYRAKSLYHYLYKQNKLYKYEAVILDFIRNKIPGINNNNKEITATFKSLKAELEEIVKDPYEKKALEYFDFISWLKSKIENRPFVEIMREKTMVVMR